MAEKLTNDRVWLYGELVWAVEHEMNFDVIEKLVDMIEEAI